MKRWVLLLGCELVVHGCSSGKPPAPVAGHTVAAVAIRDEVPQYQQLGTELFTVPRLESSYQAHWYLTETGGLRKRAELVAALTEATSKYDEVDLFLLAHGNNYDEWVADLPPSLRAKLRLVYNTGGGGTSQAREWLALGVGAYVAHPGGNVAPLFYAEFLPRWTDGERLEDAVDEANAATKQRMFGLVPVFGSQAYEEVTGRKVDLVRLWEGTEAKVFRR